MYDATTEIANLRKNKSERIFTINDRGMVKQMQEIVGAGLPKAKGEFCNWNQPNDPVTVLLKSMSWRNEEAMADVEYKQKWYPEELQILNRGKLHLIHPKFIHWSSNMIVFIVNFFTDANMIKYRRETVRVGLKQLKKEVAIFDAFKQAANSVNGLMIESLGCNVLAKIHLFLAKFSFNTYTNFRWGDKYRGEKDSSKDTSNVAFRQLLQTTGTDGSKKKKGTSATDAKGKPKKVPLATLLIGAKPSASSTVATSATASANTCASEGTLHSQSNGNDTHGPSNNNGPKRRRLTKDADVKDYYQSNYKDALKKLLDAKDFSVEHFAKNIAAHCFGVNLVSFTEIQTNHLIQKGHRKRLSGMPWK